MDATRVRPGKRMYAIGGGALLLFAVGTNVQAGWVLVVAALLLGILVAGIVLPVSAIRGVVVTRRAPARATAGDAVAVTIAVDNQTPRLRGMFRVADEFCGAGWAFVGALPARARREYAGVRTGARRGVHTSGTCVVSTGAPFGVLNVRRRIDVDTRIVVHPRTYPVADRILTGRADLPAPSATGDVSSVREYRPGDPLRHVHWRSVAKRGQLMVREFDREHLVDTAVVARLPADADAGDAVASVACSFALALARGGDVQLIGGAGDTMRTRSSDRVLDWGAHLVPGGPALGELLERVRGATTVVCVCDPVSATSHAAELVRLGGRASLHVVLVAGATDDAMDGGALAARLRAGGAAAAVLPAAEIAPWFEAGAPFAGTAAR